MDEREEGELPESNENDFGLDYNPVVRPNSSQYRRIERTMPSSDEDFSTDSDSDVPCTAKRKRPTKKMDICLLENSNAAVNKWSSGQMGGALSSVGKAKKRNNIWSTVMEEQVLSQEIGGFGLKRRLDQGDRNVESYDYTQALKLRGITPHESSDSDENEEEDDEKKMKRLERKRPIKERLSNFENKSQESSRILVEIKADPSWSDEKLGQTIAECLFEPKAEIIVRVVEVLGRECALEIYNQTKEIELNGGLMIMNGARRRTSGGVYLQLMKKNPSVNKEELAKIFPVDDTNQWRKRKRAQRKRERHDSKPKGETAGSKGLEGLFPDDLGGAKCPGSTPVTSPQHSDNEADDLAGTLINRDSCTPPLTLPTPPSPGTMNSRIVDPRAIIESLDIVSGDIAEQALDKNRKHEIYETDFLDMHGADEMDVF